MRTDTEATVELWQEQAMHNLQAAEDFKLELADARRDICELEQQLTSERALADRLHGALDALDYNLAFAGNTLIGGLRERVTAMRAIALPAIDAWKEARSECR